jgi:cysteinyl-tRNA synthetase
MSAHYLGETFDIHGGGQDLIFPHHENEIAQSTCAHGGQPLARYWIHNGFLMTEGEKMSKSLGNFYTVHDLLGAFPGEAIRLVLLQTHYRQPLDFTKNGLARAKKVLDRFYSALAACPDGTASALTPPQAIVEALEDDLNTPLALGRLHEALSTLNKAADGPARDAARDELLAGGALLGLLGQEPEAWLKGGVDLSPVPEDVIETFVRDRTTARRSKDFATADRIRDELLGFGIILEDRADGTVWRRA